MIEEAAHQGANMTEEAAPLGAKTDTIVSAQYHGAEVSTRRAHQGAEDSTRRAHQGAEHNTRITRPPVRADSSTSHAQPRGEIRAHTIPPRGEPIARIFQQHLGSEGLATQTEPDTLRAAQVFLSEVLGLSQAHPANPLGECTFDRITQGKKEPPTKSPDSRKVSPSTYGNNHHSSMH